MVRGAVVSRRIPAKKRNIRGKRATAFHIYTSSTIRMHAWKYLDYKRFTGVQCELYWYRPMHVYTYIYIYIYILYIPNFCFH